MTARPSGPKRHNKEKNLRLEPFGAKKWFYSSDWLLGLARLCKTGPPYHHLTYIYYLGDSWVTMYLYSRLDTTSGFSPGFQYWIQQRIQSCTEVKK